MHGLRSPFFLLAILLASMLDGAGQPVKRKGRAMPPRGLSCEEVCASLARAIREDPKSLTLRLEDALVISEACTPEIVATAVAVVKGDAARTREIIQTAQKVLPWRRREIEQAALFAATAPAGAAPKAAAPVVEVRRALMPDGRAEEPVEEVRRALLPEMEVRRALPPEEPVRKGKRRAG